MRKRFSLSWLHLACWSGRRLDGKRGIVVLNDMIGEMIRMFDLRDWSSIQIVFGKDLGDQWQTGGRLVECWRNDGLCGVR